MSTDVSSTSIVIPTLNFASFVDSSHSRRRRGIVRTPGRRSTSPLRLDRDSPRANLSPVDAPVSPGRRSRQEVNSPRVVRSLDFSDTHLHRGVTSDHFRTGPEMPPSEDDTRTYPRHFSSGVPRSNFGASVSSPSAFIRFPRTRTQPTDAPPPEDISADPLPTLPPRIEIAPASPSSPEPEISPRAFPDPDSDSERDSESRHIRFRKKKPSRKIRMSVKSLRDIPRFRHSDIDPSSSSSSSSSHSQSPSVPFGFPDHIDDPRLRRIQGQRVSFGGGERPKMRRPSPTRNRNGSRTRSRISINKRIRIRDSLSEYPSESSTTTTTTTRRRGGGGGGRGGDDDDVDDDMLLSVAGSGSGRASASAPMPLPGVTVPVHFLLPDFCRVELDRIVAKGENYDSPDPVDNYALQMAIREHWDKFLGEQNKNPKDGDMGGSGSPMNTPSSFRYAPTGFHSREQFFDLFRLDKVEVEPMLAPGGTSGHRRHPAALAFCLPRKHHGRSPRQHQHQRWVTSPSLGSISARVRPAAGGGGVEDEESPKNAKTPDASSASGNRIRRLSQPQESDTFEKGVDRTFVTMARPDPLEMSQIDSDDGDDDAIPKSFVGGLMCENRRLKERLRQMVGVVRVMNTECGKVRTELGKARSRVVELERELGKVRSRVELEREKSQRDEEEDLS